MTPNTGTDADSGRAASAPRENHRTVTGRIRRRRTRASLVAGALEMVAENDLDDLTIDDFIQAAGVARGTFYNHFRTKETLLNAMASDVADAVNAEFLPQFEGVSDPARRISIAIREFVLICHRRPQWGHVLVRAAPKMIAGWSDEMREGVLRDIRAGVEAGRFVVGDERAAVSMAMGVLREGVRVAIAGEPLGEYPEVLAEMTLRSYGMDSEEAQRMAREPLRDDHRG